MNDAKRRDPSSVLAEQISGIRIAMMTTIGDDGVMHSRPMMTHEIAMGDVLWFITSTQTSIARNLLARPQVNLTYVDAAAQRYVSVVGRGRCSRDSDRILELWSQEAEKWFPDGVNDPHLTLIQVEVDEADYWDGSAGQFIRLSGFIRELLGERPQVNITRGHLDLRTPGP